MTKLRFIATSDLATSPESLQAALTMAGVNAELKPLARMSAPSPWADRPIAEWPPGEPLFHSWIFLLGFLPIDRHAFRLESIMPDEGFEEASSSLMNRRWHHVRRITPLPGGCRVTDELEFESRLPLVGRLLLPAYRLVFARRHAYLRAQYGSR